MAGKYAEKTEVSSSRSRDEIERTLPPHVGRTEEVSDEQESLFRQGVDVETVGEIMGDERTRSYPVEPLTLPVLDGYPDYEFRPGIHFNLSDDDYHALPALSNGGIKKLAASPMMFWAQCRWMNPDWEPPKQEEHFEVGKCYHCRLLEGRDEFEKRYAVALDKEDYPNALVTTDDIKGAFPEGIKPRGKTKAELVEHLRSLDASVEIWDELKAEHEAANQGKCMVSARTYRQIEIAAAIIEKDPGLADMLNGGHPEVTLLWYCPKTGVPKKARVDKLKVRMMVDLKTVASKREQSIENVIRMDIANNRYPVQPSHYFEGAAEVRKLVRQLGSAAIFGDEQQTEYALKWAKHQQPDEWAWVYVLKGPAAIARGLFYPRMGTTKMLADDICTMMSKRFRKYAETFETAPWLDIAPIYDLADEDIPQWSVQI